jgi:hypothetical protein
MQCADGMSRPPASLPFAASVAALLIEGSLRGSPDLLVQVKSTAECRTVSRQRPP